METVLKTCITSVSHMFPAHGSNKESVDIPSCGMVFGSCGHPVHLSRGRRSCSPSGNTAYISCNFPSTPLPCSGAFCRDLCPEYLRDVGSFSRCCDNHLHGHLAGKPFSPSLALSLPPSLSNSSSVSHPMSVSLPSSPSIFPSTPLSSLSSVPQSLTSSPFFLPSSSFAPTSLPPHTLHSTSSSIALSTPPPSPLSTPTLPSTYFCPSIPPSFSPSSSTSEVCTSPATCYSSSTTCPSIQLKPWSSGTEECWIRPLGFVERFMTLAGSWGNMSTVYAVWLDSRGPIPFEAIKYTSHLIFRKMPHLRSCIGNHKNDRWWKKMKTDRLDIEEIQSDEDVVSIFESLLQRKYDLQDGPLWFVRFLTSVNRNDLVRDSNFNLKHKYVCIFGFHHNVTDGTTNMKFCSIFVSLLNSVLQNKEVDMKEEGRFAYPLHDEVALELTSYSYQLQLFGIRVYKSLISYCGYVNNFLRHYPMPNDGDGCTLVLQNELDEITTKRLLKRCKMEGVTLNTVFTAAANIGMLRMILQRDGSVTKTRFDSQQAVNMRRYWPKDKRERSFGCHISMVDIQIPTTTDDIVDFWEYARRVHKIIYKELNVDKNILKMQPLSVKLCLAIIANFIAAKLRLPSANDSHYCITNMGDVSSTFSGDEIEVNASKILRSVSCHYMQALCQHTLQTFKGKFYYSLDYYPQKMPVGTARAYASSIMDTLRTVIHMPN